MNLKQGRKLQGIRDHLSHFPIESGGALPKTLDYRKNANEKLVRERSATNEKLQWRNIHM